MGAYAVFAPLLAGSLPGAGSSGYVNLALGAGLATGLAAPGFVTTERITVLGSDLVVRPVENGDRPHRRCCTTLFEEDSQREFMRLDRLHEQGIIRPLPHDELVQLHGFAAQARITVDLVGQGHDLARAA